MTTSLDPSPRAAAHPSSLPGPDTAFLFESYVFDEADWSLTLGYAFDGGPRFNEVIRFQPPAAPLTAAQRAALDQACRLLFLFAGISYYKAGISRELRCLPFELDTHTAAFLREVYLKGLGEFSYRNQLDLVPLLQFQTQSSSAPSMSSPLPDHRGYLVPVGGGKDSVVSIEALKRQSDPVTLFALSSVPRLPDPIQGTITVSGLPVQVVTRALSPELFALNAAGAYNGHIPITAILSMIAVCTAILHGQKYIVLSNENSASAANLIYNEMEINHQYSKSFAFEVALSEYIHDRISHDLVYVSLLRPLSEAAIAKRFAGQSAYHSVFRSCNTAFRQDVSKRATQWCCDCPKCRFVFLALSNFMEKENLIKIFGKNLLDDNSQLDGFSELCGLTSHKPFECVGEIEESALLMQYLLSDPDWRSDVVVAQLGSQLAEKQKDFKDSYRAMFELQPGHAVPAHLIGLLNERR